MRSISSNLRCRVVCLFFCFAMNCLEIKSVCWESNSGTNVCWNSAVLRGTRQLLIRRLFFCWRFRRQWCVFSRQPVSPEPATDAPSATHTTHVGTSFRLYETHWLMSVYLVWQRIFACTSSNFEICVLLGYYQASCGDCLPTFRDNISIPSLRVKSPSRKMGPIRCPETSVKNYHTTARNTPEERRFLQHRGGSLKSVSNFV